MLSDTRTYVLYFHTLIVAVSPEAAGALPTFGLEKTLSTILVKSTHVNKPEQLKLLPIHKHHYDQSSKTLSLSIMCKAQ